VASCWKTPAFLLLGTLLGARADAAVEDRDANAVYDPALYQAMEFRSIGPYRGGRVTAVTGVPLEPDTFYMGSTGGGVWKTTNSGLDWANVSDGFFEAASMGALAVSESDPNVVYAGTGSACIRGNVSAGLGVYKSVDAGATWTHAGLRDAGQIGRIRIHPQDPNLVYVAALGHAFGPNQERGVFRSKDAGKSWEKVLYANDTTGAVDLSMDRKNGVNQQNLASLAAYLDAGPRDQPPFWRAYELSASERLVREFILQLKLGGVDRRYFREKFKTDVLESFDEPLDEAIRRGWLTIGDEAVAVTREGLVRVDRWLPAFYLPEHQNVRYS